MRTATGSLAILLIAAGCGGDGHDQAEAVTSETAQQVILAVTDTIGVLQGDGHLVFGEISDASYSSSGHIAVLDRMNSTVSFFTPQGEFVHELGGFGEAPWEFSWATSMAPMYDGWLLVSDYAGCKITVFDDTLGYSHVITGFPRTAPAGIEPLPDGTYIGRDTELWQDEQGELHGENSIRRWNTDSPEALVTFFASPMFITLLDDGLDVKPASMILAASCDGSVYCGVSSDSVFQVFGYDSRGNLVVEIEEPWERIAKTDAEMEEEGTVTAMQTDEDGNRTPVRIEVEVEPFHEAISRLACDDQGRLWVRLGSEAVPTFRVYGHTGEFLFTAACPALEGNGRQIRFQFRHGGILAWDTSPEDYPKVYLLEPLQ